MLKCYWAEIALLNEPQVFKQWLKKVNQQRREKILRCKNEKDKKRSLLAGILLWFALEQEGISYERVVFAKTKEGKPFLESHADLHFSISHAGEFAICVVSDTPVGVDIEGLDKPIFHGQRENRLRSIAEKCFAQTEWDRFEDSDQKSEVFLEYWTKKEAYSKAIGKGLGMDFSKIDTEHKKEDYWSVWITEGYCASIYRENGNYEDLQIEKVTFL